MNEAVQRHVAQSISDLPVEDQLFAVLSDLERVTAYVTKLVGVMHKMAERIDSIEAFLEGQPAPKEQKPNIILPGM